MKQHVVVEVHVEEWGGLHVRADEDASTDCDGTITSMYTVQN